MKGGATWPTTTLDKPRQLGPCQELADPGPGRRCLCQGWFDYLGATNALGGGSMSSQDPTHKVGGWWPSGQQRSEGGRSKARARVRDIRGGTGPTPGTKGSGQAVAVAKTREVGDMVVNTTAHWRERSEGRRGGREQRWRRAGHGTRTDG